MKAEPMSPGSPASGRSVLIIEDHDDAREALRALLELEGHRVDAAASGPHGLELAHRRPPDVALVDIGLPEVDGYEVARRLRAMGPGPGRPYLIALTGYGQPDDIKRARDAGFDAHLLKPVDPDALARVLSAVPRTRP
jgi:CheY-like chemotaxis protein